jgi:hypothetical protein
MVVALAWMAFGMLFAVNGLILRDAEEIFDFPGTCCELPARPVTGQ